VGSIAANLTRTGTTNLFEGAMGVGAD
jgi:hypothetical protein